MNKSEQFSRLKTLLEQQETFPFDFTLKFIGRNTDRFQKGISSFESAHPILKMQTRRESAQGNHLAMTYTFSARNADHIIATLEQVAKIEDVMVIL
jgi:putative lipoic acid-binding regulatory protein